MASGTEKGFYYCAMPKRPPENLGPNVSKNHLAFLGQYKKKWANPTVLHYCFFDKPKEWTTTEEEKNIVRKGFKVWMDVGIGIEFKEVKSISDAEVRIAFLRDNRTWSGVGRDIINVNYFGKNENTMNFGWDLVHDDPRGLDTAVHEIGHTLGAEHEHQSPFAGIEWNEKAVIDDLSGSPNYWDLETIKHNILDKISKDIVQGSEFDPNSIMEYPFKAGLINIPAKYKTAPLIPAGGLSANDIAWVKKFYPPLKPQDDVELELMKSYLLTISPGQTKTFIFKPKYTRIYTLHTIGKSDTVILLYEDQGKAEPTYMKGNDNTGTDINAQIKTKLYKGHKYLLRVKLHWQDRSGETAVIVE
jgi:hypothetical protein